MFLGATGGRKGRLTAGVRSRSQAVRWALVATILAAAGVLTWIVYTRMIAGERLNERSVMDSTAVLVREKIDRVEQLIISSDNAVIRLVDPDDLDDLVTRWPTLAERISPTVRSVLILDPDQRVLRYVSRAPDADARRFRDLFETRVLGELHLDTVLPDAHRHWHGMANGTSVMVSYFALESAERPYYVVFETDLDDIRREVFPSLFDTPGARRRFNVTDENNRLVYGKALAGAGDFLVTLRFPTTLYKWRLSIAPRYAPELEDRARHQKRDEAVYVGVSLLVILVGVIILVYAVRKEEKLNGLKSDFIATVSHELKTPLSLIRMFGEMLASERVPTPDKRRQYLDIIVRESERLTALIENVLDFARVERGRASYEFAPADLGEVVARGVELFRYRVDRDRPALVPDITPALPYTRIDERAIQLLLFNLLDNALKYAPDSDEIRIRVRASARMLTLEVEDQGPGIPPVDIKRVFERFYRGTAARTSNARGSGIGLALVKHIARAHGGDVTVRLAAVSGAIFTVTVPITPEA